jgi:HK97 gp10 family phage protein
VAKIDFTMPDDFLERVSRLEERTDEIIPKVLEAGGEVVLNTVRNNLKAVVGKDLKQPSRSTGQLMEALGLSPAKMDRNGNYNVKVGFDNKRTDGKANAMLGVILEYGKHGQPPKPFMKTAKSSTKSACIDVMKKKLEAEVSNV